MASPPCSLVLLLLWLVQIQWHSVRGLERPDINDVVPIQDPWDGVYSECLSTLSLSCVQRKLLVFVDRIGRLKRFSLLGDAVSVVRVGGAPGPPITEEGLQARLLPGQDDAVAALLQHSVLSFLESHVMRISLPQGITASLGGRALGDTFEFNLGRALQEARGKKKKKQLLVIGAMLMAKAALLGKMMMIIIKFKAIKALLLSVVALALAKIQLFKSLKSGGGSKGGKETYIIVKGGGGGDGHGGGGGGGYSSGGPSGGGWSDSGSSGGGGWSSGGGGGGGGWQADSGGGGGWPSSGGGGGSSGGWSSGGSSGGDGGGGGWSGGGGGAGGGWGRNYDASWLAYRAHAYNKTGVAHAST